MRFRLEILMPLLVLLLTGDADLARLWYSVWYIR